MRVESKTDQWQGNKEEILRKTQQILVFMALLGGSVILGTLFQLSILLYLIGAVALLYGYTGQLSINKYTKEESETK